MLTGLIFDLQRTSMHDGPGIRTAVFLKGCPLGCLWCHNPESHARTKQISFQPDACIVCGECAAVCEHGAQRLAGGVHAYERDRCEQCGRCVQACLYGALSLAGVERTAEEIMAEVRRDRAYYARSGGGLTLTGGEPLLQLEFSALLLQAARAESIHTCLETCGAVRRAAYERILPLVDLFLFDYKASDPETHRRLTGVSNERILENLDFLCRSGARVRLRCPLVPGINDSHEHLQGIAALAFRLPSLEGIDLLPYHNIGNYKYERYALVNPLPKLDSADEATRLGWLETLHTLGCDRAALG